jgi:hypothetical protein
MWESYQNAKLWGVRPSELFFIKDEYQAYCFDEAVGMWGIHVTNELERIEGKTSKEIERKRKAKLGALLGLPDEKRFRQVGGGRKKKGGE